MKQSWKVVGHRGYAARFPENTLVGFEEALALGVDAVELDVQLSQDGVPLVIHDSDLLRTTGVYGSVLNLRFEQLAQISGHFPERFGDQFAPLALASLQQIAERLAHLNAFVFIEIKKESISLLGREEYLSRVLADSESLGQKRAIISFDIGILILLKKLNASSQSPLLLGWCIEHYNAQTLEEAKALAPDMLICSEAMPDKGRPDKGKPDEEKPKSERQLWPGPWEWFVYGVETLEQANEWSLRGATWIEADDPSAVMLR